MNGGLLLDTAAWQLQITFLSLPYSMCTVTVIVTVSYSYILYILYYGYTHYRKYRMDLNLTPFTVLELRNGRLCLAKNEEYAITHEKMIIFTALLS